jgi:hypothetical protein
MLIALGIAALAALAVAFATYAVINTQKRGAAADARKFEQYKLGVDLVPACLTGRLSSHAFEPLPRRTNVTAVSQRLNAKGA